MKAAEQVLDLCSFLDFVQHIVSLLFLITFEYTVWISHCCFEVIHTNRHSIQGNAKNKLVSLCQHLNLSPDSLQTGGLYQAHFHFLSQ